MVYWEHHGDMSCDETQHSAITEINNLKIMLTANSTYLIKG